MFDNKPKEETTSPTEEKKEAGAVTEEKPVITGHSVMDKPTAVESGRLQASEASPSPPPEAPQVSPAAVEQLPAEVAGPVLQPKKPHRLRWIILIIVIAALFGTVGVWVYILNRPLPAGVDEFPSIIDREESETELTAPTPIPAPVDIDRDGLEDAEEARLGTDPNNPDSDSDGLTDNEEVNLWNTDPLKADTDGDGFNDGDEIDNGYDPAGPGRLFDINDIDL